MIRGLGKMAAWAFALMPLGCAQILDIDDPPPVGCQDGPAGGKVAAASGCPKAPSGAKAITCLDDEDAGPIQRAIENFDAVILSGRCDLGTSTLHLSSGFFLGGDAILHYRGLHDINLEDSGYAIDSDGNQNTVTGLTLDGGGIDLKLNDTTNWTGQYGWNITCNRFENISNGADAVHVHNIIGKGPPSTISHNHFTNIWGFGSGYPDFPSDPPDPPGPSEAVPGTGIFFHMGLDEVTIDDNTFDEIGYDAIKGFWDGFNGKTAQFTAHHVVISNNVLTRVHRMGIEFQGIGQNNCPGPDGVQKAYCDYAHISSDGTVLKNNFYHQPAFFRSGLPSTTIAENAFSFQAPSTNGVIINNTALADVGTCAKGGSPLGDALANSMDGGILRGNVLGTVPQTCAGSDSHGWGGYIVSEYTPSGFTNQFQNNIACGPSAKAFSRGPADNAAPVVHDNFQADECPGGADLAKSDIALVFTSKPDQELSGQGRGTWKVSVISRLSVKQVDFYLDCEASPAITQEIQDENPDFGSTRAWLYHATIDLSRLDAGPHFISAVATDAASATSKPKEQVFSR